MIHMLGDIGLFEDCVCVCAIALNDRPVSSQSIVEANLSAQEHILTI